MASNELNFKLHPGQLEIFKDPARFKVVAAGRRFGKSYLSAITLLIEGLRDTNEAGYNLEGQAVYYIAPTFAQGKEIMWGMIKRLGQDVIEQSLENQGILKLINGRQVHIKGADRPDSLRGVGLSYVVLDEYATMKPETWEEIIRPTLADVEGGALFIGTPAGKNHFYDQYVYARTSGDEEWSAWEFKSTDNPFLSRKEISRAKEIMAHETFKQEFEASFRQGGGLIFKEEMFELQEEPPTGDYYMTVDPAGYEEISGKRLTKTKRLDETAIAIVKVGEYGWWVADIITGRWNPRETALRILKAAKNYHPVAIGIESGSLKNAIMPYLKDTMRRLNTYPHIVEVKHGGKKKEERIAWALQGRMEHKRIRFNKGDYYPKLKEQMLDFPSKLTHDDMPDALAYIDQIAVVSYFDISSIDTWSPLDAEVGY